MSTLSVRLPESLHKKIKKIANRGEKTRIISARLMDRKERRIYEEV